MKNEVKHTAHSSYRCEYHIVFAPKYRRKVIYKQIRKDIGEIFRKLCNEMKVEIIEAEACVDHIHMLVRIKINSKIVYLQLVTFVFINLTQSKNNFRCQLCYFRRFTTHKLCNELKQQSQCRIKCNL